MPHVDAPIPRKGNSSMKISRSGKFLFFSVIPDSLQIYSALQSVSYMLNII